MEIKQRQSYLKQRISRMLSSPFASCNTRTISDVIARPHPPPENPPQHRQLIELFSPRATPFPSKINPIRRRSQIVKTHAHHHSHSFISLAKELVFPRRKDSSQSHHPKSLRSPAQIPDPRIMSHTEPPITPLDTLYERRRPRVQKLSSRYPRRRRHRKRKPTSHMPKRCDFDKYYHGFYSSDEDEERTLFSSRSDSSSLGRRINGNGSLSLRRTGTVVFGEQEQGKLIMGSTKVKEGYAVTKRSKDPYSDFRDSMMEMIVERQLFSARDLEKLLHAFFSLNSSRHHGVITEVYNEIRETLFSSGS